MFGKPILRQNTARKSEAVLVSDIQRAGVRLYVGLGARRGLIDIRQSATDTRATTRRFALPEACCGVRHLLHSAFCDYGADTFQS